MDSNKENFFLIVLLITIIIAFLSTALINVILFSRSRRLKYRNQILELQAKTENEIAQARNEVAEQTFMDVALELHDNLGQMLLLCMFDLNQINENNVSSSYSKIIDGRKNIQLAIEELRGISKILNTDHVLKSGLKVNIERLFSRINRSEVLRANIIWPDNCTQLFDADAELLIFRVIQELVTNSFKHSRARTINLNFLVNGDEIQINYYDDGKGYNGDLLNKPKDGQGIDNMKKRIALIKGVIEHIQNVRKGIHIYICIPYKPL